MVDTTSDPFKIVDAVYQKTVRALRKAFIPAAFEARCGWSLSRDIPGFVLAAEGALCDAAIVIDIDPTQPFTRDLAPLDPTDRLFTVLDQFSDQEALLAIDFKTIAPKACAWWAGALCTYGTGLSSPQRDCGLIIIQNPAAPHLVAVVPRHCLDRGLEDRQGVGRFFRDIPSYGHEVEPFPMELVPYVMPIQLLSQAVQNYIDFYLNPKRGWRNPYNGIKLKKLPLPVLHTAKIVLPDPNSTIRDLATEVQLWKALRKYSTRYALQRFMFRPGVGDFQIVHLSTNTRVTVEAKHDFVTISEDTLIHESHSARSKGRVFPPTAPWDVLFSVMRGPQKVFIAGRDDLPERFFTDLRAEPHQWTAGKPFLREHTFTWQEREMRAFVRRFEAYLDDRLTPSGLLGAQIIRPFTLPSPLEIEKMLGDEEALDTVKGPIVSRAVRGTGFRWAPRQWETMQERLLIRQCAKQRFGAIYRLGYHPSGTHVFVPGVWKDNKPPGFNDLDLDAVCIVLNFAPIDYTDLEEASDYRRVLLFGHATHGLSASVYILSPYAEKLEGLGLRRYVVPSTLIAADKGRVDMNEYNLKHDQTTRINLPLRLKHRERLEGYQHQEVDVIPFLTNLFGNWAACGTLVSSSPDHKDLAAFDPNLLMVTKRTIISQMISLAFGRTLFAHRLRNVLETKDDIDVDI